MDGNAKKPYPAGPENTAITAIPQTPMSPLVSMITLIVYFQYMIGSFSFASTGKRNSMVELFTRPVSGVDRKSGRGTSGISSSHVARPHSLAGFHMTSLKFKLQNY